MVIFGTKGKAFKGKVVNEETCKHCGQTQQVVTPVVRYVHIFWIPVAIYKKLTVLICPHCKKQTSSREMTGVVENRLKDIAYEGVNTYMYYTGAVFIAAVLVISLFQ